MRQWFLRYRKILPLLLLAVVVLSVVLYYRPRPFTSVYDDIDWEQLGEEIRVIYLDSDVKTSTTTLLHFYLPTEALREVLEGTYARHPFPSPYPESGSDLFIIYLPAVEEGKQYVIWIGKNGDLDFWSYPADTAAGKEEEWIVTGSAPFERLYGLIENLEPTRTDNAFAS